MAVIGSNPWSFTSTDVVSQAISAITQDANNPNILTLTVAAITGVTVGNFYTIQGTTPAGFQTTGKCLSATGTTVVLETQELAKLTYVSGGTLYRCYYPYMIRAEDMSWQNAATIGDEVKVYDRNGNPIWDSIAPTAGTYSRGKPFWIEGFTLGKLSSGTLFVTTN